MKKARWIALLPLFLALAACGSDPVEAAKRDAAEEAARFPGPSGAQITDFIHERMFGKTYAHWKVANLERIKVIEEGDAINPVVKGRIRGVAVLQEDAFRSAKASSRPSKKNWRTNGVTTVERTRKKGTEVQLFGTFVGAYKRDRWVVAAVVLELEGMEQLTLQVAMRRLLGTDRPFHAFRGNPVLVAGSKEEKAYYAKVKADEEERQRKIKESNAKRRAEHLAWLTDLMGSNPLHTRWRTADGKTQLLVHDLHDRWGTLSLSLGRLLPNGGFQDEILRGSVSKSRLHMQRAEYRLGFNASRTYRSYVLEGRPKAGRITVLVSGRGSKVTGKFQFERVSGAQPVIAKDREVVLAGKHVVRNRKTTYDLRLRIGETVKNNGVIHGVVSWKDRGSLRTRAVIGRIIGDQLCMQHAPRKRGRYSYGSRDWIRYFRIPLPKDSSRKAWILDRDVASVTATWGSALAKR